MGVSDIFSKRQKKLRGDFPDVFTYDDIPKPLRVQIIQIMRGTIGDAFGYGNESAQRIYGTIVYILRKEYGVFRLPPTREYEDPDDRAEITSFILSEPEAERVMDAVELLCRLIDRSVRQFSFRHDSNSDAKATQALDELNERFKEAGVGYQYVEGEIIRVDSELLHVETVKPVLRLLNAKHYKGAQEEFLNAYEHYRHKKNKEALNDCLKAFESTMKAICDKRGWTYDPKDTAKALIDIMFEKGLIPTFWQTQMASLRSLLESGIPTGRNKLSGHGQGTTPTIVPDYIAGYILHMTASTLVFLTSAEQALQPDATTNVTP